MPPMKDSYVASQITEHYDVHSYTVSSWGLAFYHLYCSLVLGTIIN